MNNSTTIKDIVDAGLCIGCGLCEALAKNVTMQSDNNGSLRPFPLNGFTAAEEIQCSQVCPGIHINVPASQGASPDVVWGHSLNMQYAWATDAKVRHIGSTGGVLSALGRFLLDSGEVDFIYHVKADSEKPVQSHACISETTEQVMQGAGSRYAPVAPLTRLAEALDRNQPFAVIAKPCDLSAIENLSAHDDRINQLIKYRLTMVCGGQSTSDKATTTLHNKNIEESTVTLYRHRGYGNPGPTRIETTDGRSVEISYQQLWADEAGWCLESRCKLCPDALGDCADIAAADVWPGGSPTGEDEGFNGIVVRTPAGQSLVQQACKAQTLSLGNHITAEQFNDFQPHQVRKKQALKWRLQGLETTGTLTINAPDSRLDALGEALPPDQRQREIQGAITRFAKVRSDV
ncbi:MAG: Coenzyme F420 hydrogenase/dehydrogenase, beta subunit C-terminal domain [Pseudomonadota bacterium]